MARAPTSRRKKTNRKPEPRRHKTFHKPDPRRHLDLVPRPVLLHMPQLRRRPPPPEAPNPNPNVPLYRWRPSDRLSGLHDSILSHILSFLPIHRAARTSALSRRFRHAWTDVADLHIPLPSPGDWSFVSRILSRLRSRALNTLSLVSPNSRNCVAELPSSWAVRAIIRGVRHLKIDLNTKAKSAYSKLTDYATMAILGSKTLESLELNVLLHLPPSDNLQPGKICLDNLRTLRLNHVDGIAGEHIGRIVSNCPVLEELHLIGDLGALSIAAPCLRRLKLHANARSFEPFKVCISCPRLEVFELQSAVPLKCFQGNMPCVVKASVSLGYNTMYKALGETTLAQMLRSLSNASVLDIRPFSFETYSSNYGGLLPEDEDEWLLMFHNLKKVHICTCFHEHTIEALIYLLKLSPNLTDLDVSQQGDCTCAAYYQEEWRSRGLYYNFLEHLMKFSVIFDGGSRKVNGINHELVRFLSLNVRGWEGVKKTIKSKRSTTGNTVTYDIVVL